MMMANEIEEITSLKIDEHLVYLHDSERDRDATWSIVQQVQQRDFNPEDDGNHKYRLPELKEFQLFASKIYDNYQNIGSNNDEFESDWRLFYRVKGKVIYKYFDGFFAELYFNIKNHYLLLVIKGTSSIGNVWSDIKNVVLDSKGGELDSAFTFGEKVRVLMNNFKCKPMLLITGHSLGGYLAQIITYTITYCFVDENGKVKSRKEPMDDFGIYTVVFDSPAALKQISSIDPKDPIQHERFRLPIVNFIVDVNIINSNSTVGPHHLGQVISVKEFEDSNAPNIVQRIWKVKSVHGIQKFEGIDLTQCRQIEYLPLKKTVKYEEKKIEYCFFSSKNFERLQKYLFFAAMSLKLVKRLPQFQICSSHIFLQDEKVSPEEFIPRAHRFLSQFKNDIDSDVFDGNNVINNAIYNLWRAEMLKDAHEFYLNEEWIQKVENWMDGTKIGGFESYEEMRFVGCMLHNSIPSCFHYDYEQFNGLDKTEVDNFKGSNSATLILIVTKKCQPISHKAGKRVKVLYLVPDSIADEKFTLTYSALDAHSREQLKSTQLQFMGNEVCSLDIFGNELMENLTLWEIYNFYADPGPTPNHFYNDQEISDLPAYSYDFFQSAVFFAQKLMKKEMQFVLISNDAGMGKSTALRQIALTLQQKLPNNWIVLINLFDIQYELLQAKETLTSKEAAVEFVRNLELADRKSDEVLTKVFNWKLQEKDMVLLFDSLDEVCPFYRETVEQFIALLRETQLLIVLTTRPHEGKNFKKADIFQLRPLNWRQIDNFIFKKFKILGKKPPSDAEKWLKNICDEYWFWSLPLNLNMAASIYDTDTDIAKSSGSRGKKNIYEVFLTKSIEDTLKYKFDLKKNEHQAASMDTYKRKFENFHKLFLNLAVCLMFYGGEIHKLDFKELKEKIRKNGESINRFNVAKLDNECKTVSFLHRSYAEYLVAKVFLHQCQKDLNCQALKLNNEQLNRIYFKANFSEVRRHVCQILAASPSVTIDCVPDFINDNGHRLLKILIEEDCYEFYLQLKKVNVTFYFEKINNMHPLYLALTKARKEFVRQLVNDGAKFEDILNENNVLHLAIEKSLHQEVKDHYESLKINIYAEFSDRLPLHFAAESESKDMVEFLIEKGSKVDVKKIKGLFTALYYAIKANNADVCDLLIAKGADFTKALSYAAEFGRVELFDVIYKFKITPDECRAERFRKAHFKAVKHGNLDIFKHICGFPEANPQASDSFSQTFFTRAAERGHLHCMPFILEYTNQSIDVRGSHGKTALMHALMFEHETMVEWLLEQNADILTIDDYGCSCLHHAARGGNLCAIEMCLEAGADINSQDNKGQTALFYAILLSKRNALKFLLEKGANPKILDINGNTCLHLGGDDSIVCFELLVGLLPLNCTNYWGETPLHVAARNGNESLVDFLLEEAKKRNQEPVDSDEILRLTKRVIKSRPRGCAVLQSEILEWQYIVKDV